MINSLTRYFDSSNVKIIIEIENQQYGDNVLCKTFRVDTESR